MKALVSGAGGFLGRHVVDRLLQRGHKVRAIVRPASSHLNWGGDVEIARADLRVHGNLASLFDGVDVVLHLAAATSGDEDAQFASTVVATERFLGAMARTSVKRLVHVSSFVVYDWARARGVLDENTSLVTDIYGLGGYTIAKVWQERIVMRFAKASAWDMTIMRPGFIWGRDHAEIAAMGRRIGRINLMFGPFARLPLTHVVNCADSLVTAAEKEAAIGQNFNVIDGDDVRVWRYVREYVRRSGKGGVALPVPYRAGLGVAQLAAMTSRILFGQNGKLPSLLTPRRFESQFKPVRFPNRKLRDTLSWRPPLSFDECLAATYTQTN
jgi:UDP-glucose 4-epimerase